MRTSEQGARNKIHVNNSASTITGSRIDRFRDSPWICDAYRVPHPSIVCGQIILRRGQVSRTRQRGRHGGRKPDWRRNNTMQQPGSVASVYNVQTRLVDSTARVAISKGRWPGPAGCGNFWPKGSSQTNLCRISKTTISATAGFCLRSDLGWSARLFFLVVRKRPEPPQS